MTDNECTTCGRAGHIAEDCPYNKAAPRWLAIGACLGILLAVALMAGCASAPKGDSTIELTADQVRMCQEQGGCAVFTRARVAQLMDKAAAAGRAICGREQPL